MDIINPKTVFDLSIVCFGKILITGSTGGIGINSHIVPAEISGKVQGRHDRQIAAQTMAGDREFFIRGQLMDLFQHFIPERLIDPGDAPVTVSGVFYIGKENLKKIQIRIQIGGLIRAPKSQHQPLR